MLTLVVRIALTALAVGFLGWLGYVIYLGLQSFFGKKKTDVEASHKKHHGKIGPIDE